jgi:hypothetical protein
MDMGVDVDMDMDVDMDVDMAMDMAVDVAVDVDVDMGMDMDMAIFLLFRFVLNSLWMFRLYRNTETSCFDIKAKQPEPTSCFG